MQGARICIISKNKELSRFFELELKNMDCDVRVRTDADTAEPFDAVIVDKDTVKSAVKCACPTLSVSSDITDDDNALLWPTPVKSIREKLYLLLRERTDSSGATQSKTWDDRVYKTGDRSFLINGTSVELSKNEAAILTELCRASGEIVPRSKIMELLGATEGNISDVYICLLRKKLEAKFGRRLIFTHRSKGYSTCLIYN